MNDAPLNVIFGAGQVGAPLAHVLRDAGCRVRVIRRAAVHAADGVEHIAGDAADSELCRSATAHAVAVYHCMNPAYSGREWERVVPRYMENLIAAAGRAGARLIVLDNLYMLGRTGGRPMNEDTPMNPVSRKGEIRARAAQRLFDAHAKGEVRATTARASDYFGPGGTLTHFGDVFWKDVVAGRAGPMLIEPDAVHTYHYIPDVAAGLAAIGLAGDDVIHGRPWMLPCASAGTARDLVGRFGEALGREIRIAAMPPLVRRAVGLFMPMLREVEEMLYQWDEPFVVDDRRFRERFPVRPADAGDAARATVDWARRHYSR